jgi:hypothetical protein
MRMICKRGVDPKADRYQDLLRALVSLCKPLDRKGKLESLSQDCGI